MTARRPLGALFWACLAAWTPPASAQNPDEEDLALAYGDKATVSIATGSALALRRAPAVASIITADEIAAMGATDLDEVLEAVPGIHVGRTSIRYAATYIIRGTSGNAQSNPQVLLLQDGIPMTTMFNGDKGSAWRGTSVANIARIEVIRGPGSALYGADAYTGVINIITKTAAEAAGTEASMGAGSLASRDVWVQHGGQAGPAAVAAYLRVGTTDGFKETVAADAQTRNDRLFGTHASRAPGPVNTRYDAVDGSLNVTYGRWRLLGTYKLRDDLGTGAGISSALVPDGGGRAEIASGSLSWTDLQFAQNWGFGFTASYLHYTFTYPDNVMLLPPGARLPTGAFPDGLIGGPNQWEQQLRLSAFATYAGFAGHNLRFGIGHDDLDLYKTRTYKNYILNAAGTPVPTGPVIDYSDIQPFIRPHRRRIAYVYVQDEWRLAQDWTLTAGARHDDYSDFGGTTNPRVALVWDAAFNVTAKLLYGRAFRAPAFNEQYGINPVANGNAQLRPETIDTLETALSWQLRKDAHLAINAFRYTMRDMIRLVANGAPAVGATFQNVGRQHGSGVELEFAWDASPRLRFSGNYAYQRSLDEATHQDAGYAPRHHAYARADWRVAAPWTLGAQFNRVTDRKRALGDNRPPVPDYSTVDISLRSKPVGDQWTFTFGIRNLFDADVREPTVPPLIPNDLPMAPRTAYFQASYTI